MMPAAMAAGGVFPKPLARLASNGVPLRAHILSGCLVTAVLAFNASKTTVSLFTFVALVATIATLVLYIFVAAAALRLGGARRWVAIAGVVYSLWAFYGAGIQVNLWVLVLILAGVPVWWVMRRPKLATL